MTETKRFHIGDIISVTTDRLVSPTLMEGLYGILNWVTDDNMFTHQLIRTQDEAAPFLREQFPDLAAVTVPDREWTMESIVEWLGTLGEQYRDVPRMPSRDHARIDPMTRTLSRRSSGHHGGDVTTAPYVYRIASVLRVVDGDSFWAYVDVGFYETKLINIRLMGVDCPEKRQGSPFERRKAAEAARFTGQWLADVDEAFDLIGAESYWVRTEKDPDNFGRWLGEVWREDENAAPRYLTGALVAAQFAVRWPTRWHEVYDPERNKP
jgi:endonuclease YncB( thermonuclease family)